MKISRLLMAAPLLMATSIAFAYPKVGDKAQYKGTLTQGTTPATELVVDKEVLLFNDLAKKWIVKVDETMNGSTKTELVDVDDAKMYTPAMYQQVMAQCVAKGGTVEAITTPAGNFNTCHGKMMEPDGDWKEAWIGDVPFGIVKMNKFDAEDNETISVELQSFTAAQ